MKRKLTRLARDYRLALQVHLQPGASTSLVPALGLGRQAATFGLETLDVIQMHVAALAALEPTGRWAGSNQRAKLFFAEAVTPIEQIHRAARQADAHFNQLAKMLSRRTLNLAAAQRSLQHGIAQRKSAEQFLKKSAGNYTRLARESGQLQKYLRSLTRQILSSQEVERTKISQKLHHEVAQILLGINVQLLRLKQATAINLAGLKKEIASTQRLVKTSTRLME